MTTSSTDPADRQRIEQLLADAGLGSATHIERVHGGRNSRLYEVRTRSGAHLAAKLYGVDGAANSDRQARESKALRLMHRLGIKSVPSLLCDDRERGASAMTWLDGVAAQKTPVTRVDGVRAAELLLELCAHRNHPATQDIGEASEAALSMCQVVDSIARRLEHLEARRDSGQVNDGALAAFLRDSLRPAFDEALAKQEYLGAQLPRRARILTPSDFGFHNAIRTPSGGLAFVDFEHFGWDDPAKTLVDFHLHPAMTQNRFAVQAFGEHFSERLADSELQSRARALFPLLVIKWSLILLNDFVPASAARRTFSSTANPSIAPAQEMLEKLHSENLRL